MNFGGRTDVSLVRELFSHHHIEPTPENFARFFERYAFWLDHLLAHSHGTTCPGVREFIRSLQELPQPPLLGLLTGNIRLGSEIKLRHFNLWEVFETGAFGDDHEDRNQIAAIARQRGSRRLNEELCGRQVLVVGDTPHDVRCGKHIGAKVLAVATGGATLEELKPQSPDWTVPDLKRVSAGEVCA